MDAKQQNQENIKAPEKPVLFFDQMDWMRNIKKIIRYFFKVYMIVCTIGFTGLLFSSFLIDLGTWIALDFSPYYREIDSCMDAGGIWIDDKNICDGARTY